MFIVLFVDLCSVQPVFRHLVKKCNVAYSVFAANSEDYAPYWEKVKVNTSGSCSLTKHAYCYQSWAELDSYPYIGQHGVYAGGGYVAELKGSLTDLYNIVDDLENQGWIDKYTRAVFVEFSIYNPSNNLFGIVILLAEFLPSGGITMTYRIDAVNLIQYTTGAMLFQLVCQFIFVCFIIFFLVKEYRKLRKEKKEYFKEFWNWVEILILGLSVAATVIFVYRMLIAKQLTAKFKDTHGNSYINFQRVGSWNELLTIMVGWLVYLSTLKFLKLLRFNRRMLVLGATLRNAATGLSMFFIMFMIVFLSFTQVFYGTLGNMLKEYSSMIIAAETLLSTMLGKFDFRALQVTRPLLGPLLFILYVCTTTFLLINMFVSIINESFGAVRADVESRDNEYEIVEFMVRRFKLFIGVKVTPVPDHKETTLQNELKDNYETEYPITEYSTDGFPKRVNEFLDCVSRIYFENDPYQLKYNGSLKGQAK